MSEPTLPWDTTSQEDRLVILRGAFLGCSWRRRDTIRQLPSRSRDDRGEDSSATKSRILARWAARTAVLVEQSHDLALAEQTHRGEHTTIRPIKGWGRGKS